MCYGQEISNAMVRARKPHVCDWCGESIEPKTKYWKWVGIVEGDPSSTKMHPECEQAVSEQQKKNGFESCWVIERNQPRGGYDEENASWF